MAGNGTPSGDREQLLSDADRSNPPQQVAEAPEVDFEEQLHDLPGLVMDQSQINQIHWDEFAGYVTLDAVILLFFIPFYIAIRNSPNPFSPGSTYGDAGPIVVTITTYWTYMGVGGLMVAAIEIIADLATDPDGKKDLLKHGGRLLPATLVLAGITLGVYLWQPVLFTPVIWLNIVLVILPLLSALVVFGETNVYRSRLACAVTNREVIVFDAPFEVYLLLKSVRHATTKHMISFIRTGEGAPPRKLKISSHTVNPFISTLVSLRQLEWREDGKLKQFPPDGENYYKNFYKHRRLQKDGRFWDEDIQSFVKGTLSGCPFPKGGLWCAELSGIEMTRSLQQHWFSKTMMSLMWRLVLLSGPVLYGLRLWGLFGEHCEGKPTQMIIDGKNICNGEDCQELCGLLPSFVQKVQESLHVSPAELALPLVMIIVDVIVGTFLRMRQDHVELERVYLKSLPIPSSLIEEVLRYKDMLEDLLSPLTVAKETILTFGVWKRWIKDPRFTFDADFREEDLDIQSGPPPNQALRRVVKSMCGDREGVSRLVVECMPEDYAKGQAGVGVKLGQAREEYEKKKPKNDTEGTPLGIRVTADVWVKAEDWPKLVQELLGPQGKYRSCMQENIQRTDARSKNDYGKCWLEEPLMLGPYANVDDGADPKRPVFVIPGGFTLSHVACLTADGQFQRYNLMAAIVNQKKEKDKQITNVDDLTKLLLGEPFQDGSREIRDFSKLFGGADVDSLDAEVFVVRFTMTSDCFLSYVRERSFDSRPAELRYAPPPEAVATCGQSTWQLSDPNPALSQSGGYLMAVAETMPPGGYSYITYYLGTSPESAFWDLFFRTLSAWSFLIGAALFPLVAPTMRVYVEGGDFFPSALRTELVLSTFVQFLVLAYYLGAFTVTRRKLEYVHRMLKDFDDYTLAPKVTASGNSPFELVIVDSSNEPYNPKSDYWQSQWNAKRLNLDNWRRTSEYLQVFLGTVRLSAQGLLIASALMVVDLLVLSLVQAWQGKGAFHVDKAKMMKAAQSMAKTGIKEGVKLGQKAKDKVVGAVQNATNLASSKAVQEAARRLSSGVRTGQGLALYAASQQLHEALQPVYHTLHHAVGLQVGYLAEALEGSLHEEGRRLAMTTQPAKLPAWMEKGSGADMLHSVSLGDMSKVTKTQVMTIVFLLLVLAYSVPMILYIAQVNDYLSRHAYLMSSTKVKHQTNQATRENSAADAAAEAAGASVEQPASGGGDAPAAGGGDAPTADGGGDATGKSVLDPGLSRYERTLDANIKSATKNTFPLTVFGFVINTALIVSWLLLAASPIFSELKQMVPPLAAQACHKIETSKLFHDLQHAVDSGVDAANKGLEAAQDMAENIDAQVNKVKSDLNAQADAVTGSDEKFVDSDSKDAQKALSSGIDSAMDQTGITKVAGMKMEGGKMHFNAVQFFDQSVCKPLVAWMKQQADAAIGNATERIRGLEIPQKGARRLSELPLEAAVSEWWSATPGDPEAKLLIMKLQLDDLQREAERLLVSAPKAVEAALYEHGAVSSLDWALWFYQAKSRSPEEHETHRLEL
eukprot:TRINITY_DN3030_c0_g2_i1.p1 TRINITY_DN3030_c0_g2~~TRINITY_DN3030_c0_g2_i1.p1  ORF type:complete len:1548 (-),score=273.96 TRINITY_DN3030_c0_g2_i1:16-4659(-)